MTDRILIRSGTILDGSGAPPFRGDVLIENGRIADISHDASDIDAASQNGQVIKAAGLYVAPGFIDTHIHTDIQLLIDPQQEASLRQGVTTHTIGQDGISFAPASPATMAYMRDYFGAINTIPDLDWNWSSVQEYLARLNGRTAVNVAYLVPHGNLRMEAMGLAPRKATRDEIKTMQTFAAAGMREGAKGYSTGLDYLPGAYADTNELVRIAETVREHGGVYVTHMRINKLGLLDSMREAFAISRASGVPLHISHLNGRADEILPLLNQAEQEGIDFTFESYCYLASCTILAMHVLPEWVQEGGPAPTVGRLRDPNVRKKLQGWFEMPERGLDQLQLSYVPNHADEEGLRLLDAAERAGLTPTDFICERLVETGMQVCAIAYQTNKRTEQDMVTLMQHPAHMAGSDGIFSGGKPHPRGCGCFARFLAYHTRARGDYAWAQAIWHLSGHAAKRFGLDKRGQLQRGFAADVVVFDPAQLRDRATFESGKQYATGMEHVIVNGKLALTNGQVTGTYAGRVV
ncbi:MAG: D-aminoacylase [Anaerolineae bacterium]|nr:D-aminoacylase [Anaerolineae bacterium]